jgi:transposase
MKTNRTTTSSATPERPSTEAQPRRGIWSAAQRLAILQEYESYPKGDTRRGELLRRHGLYTSHMSKWRAQRDRGALARLEPRPAGRPANDRDPQQLDELARLQRENARLQTELHKATTIIEIQKKLRRCLASCCRPHPAAMADAGRSPGTGPDGGDSRRLRRAGRTAQQLLPRPAAQTTRRTRSQSVPHAPGTQPCRGADYP